ncbi:hypothetical protein DL766_005759 [Monosporascus sp. MC13-8B]|uniref:Uncharacterized protein n=1 Tax=Monosporascus cannonballus TaxID=155416 RepID=A0ABY0GVA0_9PEZI|nr:hypothetical protein DL763_011066 [Monosporascus cannonballus]RYO78121.1 hypothetical protein DL762_008858 [Monosporascus cannonballus]RYP28659.1 hypothetical protein DL766_005759 [Monosporascus sp. MC13-8B]
MVFRQGLFGATGFVMGLHCASLVRPPRRPGPNQYVQPYNYQEAADALAFFQNATAAEFRQARNRFATDTDAGFDRLNTFPRARFPERRGRGNWPAVMQGAVDRSTADAGVTPQTPRRERPQCRPGSPAPGSRERPFTFDDEEDEEDDVFGTDSRGRRTSPPRASGGDSTRQIRSASSREIHFSLDENGRTGGLSTQKRPESFPLAQGIRDLQQSSRPIFNSSSAHWIHRKGQHRLPKDLRGRVKKNGEARGGGMNMVSGKPPSGLLDTYRYGFRHNPLLSPHIPPLDKNRPLNLNLRLNRNLYSLKSPQPSTVG